MDSLTREEVVFAQTMQRAPELITDRESASIGRFMGNLAHLIGPPFKVFMMGAGTGEIPEYVFIGIGKNLEERIARLVKSSPIPTRVAVYSMVPKWKYALALQKEIRGFLNEFYAHTQSGWYHVPGGQIEAATHIFSDTLNRYTCTSTIYRYDPRVKKSALKDMRKKLLALHEKVEDSVRLQ